ncbi:MAG: DUF58 domain-containing protein [Gammaproteobacteria bacterium]|nr:DUF58 domain-containing protein [Gammaproteobacteria bacterium]
MSVLTGAWVEGRDLLSLRYRRFEAPDQAARQLGRQAGLKLSRQKGRGVDFAEVRLYEPGDDVRTIDWRVTARKQNVHTKVFREERERPVLFLVDQSQSLFFGSRVRLKSVAAAEAAGLLAWQTLSDHDRVGGLVLGNQRYAVHRPYRSLRPVARFLYDVAGFNRELSRQGIIDRAVRSEAMLALRRLVHTGFRIILISDFATHFDLWQDLVYALARHNRVALVHIVDPLEADLPPADLYAVTDGHTRLQFDSSDTRLRDRYRSRYAERLAAIEALSRHEYVSCRRIGTDAPDLLPLLSGL